ncbi:MAG: large conductance mechanosensitive channel protein MscL [Anaerovoracaceae bacterium]|jgi:large conductance mechanosensitive channel
MWKEFKEFAFKGNAMDMAVAVVLGTAFTAIVNALVDGIITPIIGIVIGGIDFSSLAFTVGSASIKYGMVIQQTISFVLIALVMFLIIKGINRMDRAARTLVGAKKEDEEAAAPTQEELLTEIRDILKEQKAG